FSDKNLIEQLNFTRLNRLRNLKLLDLSHNQLYGLKSNMFANMSNLESLSVSFNKLACVEARAFAGLSKLKVLLTTPKCNICSSTEPCLNGGTCRTVSYDRFACDCPARIRGQTVPEPAGRLLRQSVSQSGRVRGPAFRTLQIGGNPLSTTGCMDILESLTGLNCSISLLDLRCCERFRNACSNNWSWSGISLPSRRSPASHDLIGQRMEQRRDPMAQKAGIKLKENEVEELIYQLKKGGEGRNKEEKLKGDINYKAHRGRESAKNSARCHWLMSSSGVGATGSGVVAAPVDAAPPTLLKPLSVETPLGNKKSPTPAKGRKHHAKKAVEKEID
uniref:EGF-like domain-containing protein n=1 Tax=Macrostomum lignano TaxID=282301 RepID=A0A1I8FAM6_9PLAT